MKKIMFAVMISISSIYFLPGCCTHRNPTMPVFPSETVVCSHTGSISGFVSMCPRQCSCGTDKFGTPIPFGTITGTPTPVPTATATLTPNLTPHATCPVVNAPVRIFSGTTVVANTTTDTNGFYKVSGLAPGTYSAQITVPGYAVSTLSSIVVTAGAESSGNNLTSTYLYHAGEILIYFNSGLNASDETAYIAGLGATVVFNNQYIITAGTPPVLGDEYLIQLPAGAMPLDAVTQVQANPMVNMATVFNYYCLCPI